MKILLLTDKFKNLRDYCEDSYVIHILNNQLSMGLLLQKLSYYQLINYQIILGEVEKLYREQHKIEIEQMLIKYEEEKPIFYIPEGMLSPLLIYHFSINEIQSFPVDERQTSIAISEEFFHIHKIQCILHRQIKPILFYIISRPKFLVKYLHFFIMRHHLWDQVGYYVNEDKVLCSIEEGLEFLDSQKWIINKKKLSEIMEFYTTQYKENEIEEPIYICNCNYICYKDMGNEFYFPIKSEIIKYKIKPELLPTRELYLPLKKEVEISNPMEFYKRRILKSVGKSKYKKILKAPKLHVKKITHEFHIRY